MHFEYHLDYTKFINGGVCPTLSLVRIWNRLLGWQAPAIIFDQQAFLHFNLVLLFKFRAQFAQLQGFPHAPLAVIYYPILLIEYLNSDAAIANFRVELRRYLQSFDFFVFFGYANDFVGHTLQTDGQVQASPLAHLINLKSDLEDVLGDTGLSDFNQNFFWIFEDGDRIPRIQLSLLLESCEEVRPLV